MGLNLYQSRAIYSDLLAYSRFPEDLFGGPGPLMQALREAIRTVSARASERASAGRVGSQSPRSLPGGRRSEHRQQSPP